MHTDPDVNAQIPASTLDTRMYAICGVAVKELKLSYYKKEPTIFTIYPIAWQLKLNSLTATPLLRRGLERFFIISSLAAPASKPVQTAEARAGQHFLHPNRSFRHHNLRKKMMASVKTLGRTPAS